MSDKRAEEASEQTPDPRGKELWHELADNVMKPSAQPAGFTYEGPGEPGEGTDPADATAGEIIPGVLGGPPVIVTRENKD